MSERSYICKGCSGKVRLPKGRRAKPESLAQLMQVHEETCPRRTRK